MKITILRFIYCTIFSLLIPLGGAYFIKIADLSVNYKIIISAGLFIFWALWMRVFVDMPLVEKEQKKDYS